MIWKLAVSVLLKIKSFFPVRRRSTENSSTIAINTELKTMDKWKICYPKTLNFEGGFQDNPYDRGNWTGGERGIGELKGTKFGISAKSYPDIDIKNLTKEQAIEIYHRDYWSALYLDLIESVRVAWKIFDIAVNCAQRKAAIMVQRAVGVVPDGYIGEVTLGAINASEPMVVLNKLVKLQQAHYMSINEVYRRENGEDSPFFKGWMIRSEDIAQELKDETR